MPSFLVAGDPARSSAWSTTAFGRKRARSQSALGRSGAPSAVFQIDGYSLSQGESGALAMSAFQHMVTLLSFVLALGVAHQLLSIVQIVRAGPRVKLSFVHALWMMTAFLQVIGWWFGIWDLKDIKEWPFAAVMANSIFPHLDHPDLPENTMADAERWATEIAGPAYAIDDETAIKVADGSVEVISEGHWKLFTP